MEVFLAAQCRRTGNCHWLTIFATIVEMMEFWDQPTRITVGTAPKLLKIGKNIRRNKPVSMSYQPYPFLVFADYKLCVLLNDGENTMRSMETYVSQEQQLELALNRAELETRLALPLRRQSLVEILTGS